MTSRQKFNIVRHNAVLSTLYHSTLKLGRTSFLEKSLPTIAQPRKRPDLTILTPDGTFIVDVAIVCPTAPSHLPLSSRHQLAAAVTEEHRKQDSYHDLQLEQPHLRFFPFVLESTGGFGNSASDLLSALSTYASHNPAAWLADTTNCIAATIQSSHAFTHLHSSHLSLAPERV